MSDEITVRTDEGITVRHDDGYGWYVATDIKAAELFLALYKETGEEYQKRRAEKLADKLAKRIGANPESSKVSGGVG